MGHCDQQSHQFPKLTPLLNVSLVTQRSLPVVAVFKMCVASWLGWVGTALIRDLLYLLPTVGSVSKKWKSRRKSQNQQNFQCSRRPTASSWKKVRPISIDLMRSFAQHFLRNNGFSWANTKNERLAIKEQTDESCMRTESWTYQPFS